MHILETVKPGIIVNAFRGAGIYPPNRCAINEKKLLPAKVHAAQKTDEPAPTGSRLVLLALEQELEPEVVKKYEARWAEDYDLTDDPLYNAWAKLKQKVSRVPLSNITNTKTSNLESILQVPVKVNSNPQSEGLPAFLNTRYLEEQKSKKENAEREKEERRQQREERKKVREVEEREKEECKRQREAARVKRVKKKEEEKRKKGTEKATEKTDEKSITRERASS